MTVPLLIDYIYNFTRFVFHALYALMLVSREVCYLVYMIGVEIVILPVFDSLWTIESRLVRIVCRVILTPHVLLMLRMMTYRNNDNIRAINWHHLAVEGAAPARADQGLHSREGFCLSNLKTFVKDELGYVCSGVVVKFMEGTKLQEMKLYRKLQGMYSRPLGGLHAGRLEL